MSFSNAPDTITLGRVAGALAVDEAFVEKDWFVVRAIAVLVAVGGEDTTPIFSGGTSLLKGYGLIKRFSEDIDFKLGLSAGFADLSGGQRRRALGDFRDKLNDAWKAAGFDVTSVVARDANGFLQFEMDYPSILKGHHALRPHILAELSAKPPRLAAQSRPLSSYVAQFRRADAEVAAIACVDPVETAADKLSAFSWRSLVRDRASARDDPAIVRHLHDLAALEAAASASSDFPALLAETLVADAGRGGETTTKLAPRDRLAAMLDTLQGDALYPPEYARFVEGMAFAGRQRGSVVRASGGGRETALRALAKLTLPIRSSNSHADPAERWPPFRQTPSHRANSSAPAFTAQARQEGCLPVRRSSAHEVGRNWRRAKRPSVILFLSRVGRVNMNSQTRCCPASQRACHWRAALRREPDSTGSRISAIGRAMTTIETYLANAAAQRAAAEKTNLPNRREMHERSAVTWETMARAAEDTLGRAAVNLASKMSAAG